MDKKKTIPAYVVRLVGVERRMVPSCDQELVDQVSFLLEQIHGQQL
jgi:hypothetical protein